MNSHYDNNTLLLFLSEELSVEEQHAVKDHVTNCKPCQHELTLLQETLNIYRQLPSEIPAREILSNILSEKEQAPHELRIHPVGTRLRLWYESLLSRHPRWLFQPATAAVVLILVVGSVFILFKHLSRQQASKNPEPTILISEWRSPTDFLLKSPGEELLKSVPKIGQSLKLTQLNWRKI